VVCPSIKYSGFCVCVAVCMSFSACIWVRRCNPVVVRVAIRVMYQRCFVVYIYFNIIVLVMIAQKFISDDPPHSFRLHWLIAVAGSRVL
jgi:hypothetical protein